MFCSLQFTRGVMEARVHLRAACHASQQPTLACGGSPGQISAVRGRGDTTGSPFYPPPPLLQRPPWHSRIQNSITRHAGDSARRPAESRGERGSDRGEGSHVRPAGGRPLHTCSPRRCDEGRVSGSVPSPASQEQASIFQENGMPSVGAVEYFPGKRNASVGSHC